MLLTVQTDQWIEDGAQSQDESLREQRDLAVALSAVSDLGQAAQLCAETAMRRADCECAGFYLFNQELGQFVAFYSHGLSKECTQRALWIIQSSEHARQIMAGVPVYLSNDQLPEPVSQARNMEGLRAIGVIPILDKGRIMACLNVASRAIDEISPASRPALEAIAFLAGAVIRRILLEHEKQKLELQLSHSSKMEAVGTLAGGIAHEFNNMLYVILGNLHRALRNLEPDSPLREPLEEARKTAQRQADLVRQIVAFSRQDRDERKAMMPHPVIEETLQMLQASLPASIQIRRNLSGQAGPILASPGQIQQALMHLCANAEYSMREKGGVIEIGLDRVDAGGGDVAPGGNLAPGPYARLVVRDTGGGMDRMILSRIFDPFFTTKPVNEGTGLGLSVVHGIVKKHGGQIAVESAVGKGSVFTLCFPIIEEASSGEPQEAAALSHSKARVLFVDSESYVVALARQMLTHLGYCAVAFTGSRPAIEAFREAPDQFDLAITDQMIPEAGGLGLVDELKRLRPDIPIIWCSGFSQKARADEARQLGIREIIMKPILECDLAAAIQRALGA